MISTPDNSSPISSSSVTNCEAPGILEHYTVDGKIVFIFNNLIYFFFIESIFNFLLTFIK